MFKKKRPFAPPFRLRYERGLSALEKARDDVDKFKADLRSKTIELEIKKEDADKVLEEMGVKRAEADRLASSADEERAKAEAAGDEARGHSDQAGADLLNAQPFLEAAEACLGALEKDAVAELKGLAKPPTGVDKLTAALLMMINGEKKVRQAGEALLL